MKEFTSKNLDELRKDLKAVLGVVEDLHGITLEVGSISYSIDGKSCHMKLSSTCAQDENGKTLNKFELDYLEMIKTDKMFDSGKEFLDLGETFISNGNRYSVAGWKPRSRKYPLLGISDKGARYKFPAIKAERKK